MPTASESWQCLYVSLNGLQAAQNTWRRNGQTRGRSLPGHEVRAGFLPLLLGVYSSLQSFFDDHMHF